MISSLKPFTLFFLLLGFMNLSTNEAWAHCDGLGGPVVGAARQSLESGDIDKVLIWVQDEHEAEIRKAFEKTRSVRKLGPEARSLADTYFFETVVRLHRAGEGAPYTGLKPAGRDLGPAIPAADEAIASGSLQALKELIQAHMESGLRNHFEAVMAKQSFAPDDVAAGRDYVEAYVQFIHYVESLYEAAAHKVDGHYPDHPGE